MRFILQQIAGMDIDILLLKEILTRRSLLDSFEEMTIEELRRAKTDLIRDSIPAGIFHFF